MKELKVLKLQFLGARSIYSPVMMVLMLQVIITIQPQMDIPGRIVLIFLQIINLVLMEDIL